MDMNSLRLFPKLFFKLLSFLLLLIVQATVSYADTKIYYDNGTKIEQTDIGFELKLRTEIATYFSNTSFTNAHKNQLTDTEGNNVSNSNSFDIAHATFVIAGNFENKRFSFFTEYGIDDCDLTLIHDFSDHDSADDMRLLESWIQWNSPNNRAKIRVGKQMVPFGLQNGIHDNDGQFISKSLPLAILNADFGNVKVQNGAKTINHFWTSTAHLEERNIGIIGQSENTNDGKSTKYIWTTGVLNGNGDENGNSDKYLLGLLGVSAASANYDRHDEGDRDFSNELEWTTGISATVGRLETDLIHPFLANGTIKRGKATILNGAVDFGIKYKGFSWQNEFIMNFADFGGADDNRNLGYYTQLGYFIIPKEQEIAFRFAGFNWDKNIAKSRDSFEYSLAYNYYLIGSFLKLQANVSYYDLNLPLTNQQKAQAVKTMVGVNGVF